MSEEMKKDIQKMTKDGGYVSVSEFIRTVVRFYLDNKQFANKKKK